MKVAEIYQKYKIPPQLQLHQLRVAAVAKYICDNFTREIDTQEIITADLFHDMGNIIKFDLTLFPEYLEPEGYDYWRKVQLDFIEKYGNEEHLATYEIAREIGISPRSFDILQSIGSSKSQQRLRDDDYSRKIAHYVDGRVSPNGVVSIKSRVADVNKRVLMRKKNQPQRRMTKPETAENFLKIQNQLQKYSKIDLEEITDDTIKGIVEELRVSRFPK